jgi:hypothetical protein
MLNCGPQRSSSVQKHKVRWKKALLNSLKCFQSSDVFATSPGKCDEHTWEEPVYFLLWLINLKYNSN